MGEVRAALISACLFLEACSGHVIVDEVPNPPPVAGVRILGTVEVWAAGALVAVLEGGCTVGVLVGLQCGGDAELGEDEGDANP